MRKTSQLHLDFLAWKPIRAIVTTPAFPVVLQITALAGVVWLAMQGLDIGVGMKGDELMTLRKTSLTTLFVWGLWWPGMIALVLAFGRVWCTICPMELVNRFGHAVAKKLGWPQARLGKLLRAGWITVLLYLVLQILVAGMSIHRVPHYTAIMLFTLIGLALLSGLVFREHRSFCKAFCPSAALLSVYGRYTPMQLEVRELSVCDGCVTKDCVVPANLDRFDKRSCASRLAPYRRTPSDGCVLCLQCAKVCPHQNMGFGVVAANARIREKTLLRPFEAAFVMVALGFVAHEVVGEVKWLDTIFHAIPARLNALVPSVAFGWFEALWFLVLFPLVVWATISAIASLVGHCAGIRSLLLSAATGAAPVVAAAHLAKAVAKMASWGGFLPLALRDPQGIATLHRISQHSLAAPASFMGLSMVGWVILVATVFVAVKVWHNASDLSKEFVNATRVGLLVSSLLFSAVLVTWIF
jgi:polyferredoxin